MGIVNSRPTSRSAFSWRPVPLTLRRYKPPFLLTSREIMYEITKPAYDLIFKTSFVQTKIIDALQAQLNEVFTLTRAFAPHVVDPLDPLVEGNHYYYLSTYSFESPSHQQRHGISLQIQDNHEIHYMVPWEKKYTLSLSSRSHIFGIARKALEAALEEAKTSYEAHVSERNSLVALALTGKDDTRRGQAMEIFAQNYYPESIRTASGARVDVDSSSIPALARQYSQALRNPQIDEVLFNR